MKTGLEIIFLNGKKEHTITNGKEEQNARTTQRSLFEKSDKQVDQEGKPGKSRPAAPAAPGKKGRTGKPGKGEISEPGQNYTLEEPKTAIDFKLKPQQIDLPFGKKSDIFSKTVSHAARRMAIPTT